ncbi:MAG: DUF4367 domain-containing protein [Defluviitaleaceae bacterium]|nr:DUF4367 domain-containing protein [Defluviitaleaceae bacterium]
MRKNDFDEEFIAKFRNTDFSSESKNKEVNLEILKARLTTINEEGDTYMKKGIRKPLAVAACAAIILTVSVTAFGQELVRYVRSVMLGDHAGFIIAEEIREEDREALREERQALIDEGYLTASESTDFDEPAWLTFTDAEEGRSHFITDALLPAYLPEGFAFKHIFYFVESVEELGEYGANKYMGVVFSNGVDELPVQVRFMDETTAFALSATENIRTVEINGHEAVVDLNSVNILIGDVMYFFFGGTGNVDVEELIRMAESLS